jgi:hypothetical protein
MDQLLSYWEHEKLYGSNWAMDQAQNTGHHGKAMEETENYPEEPSMVLRGLPFQFHG